MALSDILERTSLQRQQTRGRPHYPLRQQLREAAFHVLCALLGVALLHLVGCSEGATQRKPEDVLLRVDKVTFGTDAVVTVEGHLVASGYDRDATLELHVLRTDGNVIVTPHVSARKLSGVIRHVAWSFVVDADELPATVIKGSIEPHNWRDMTLRARRIDFDWLQDRPNELAPWLQEKGYNVTDEWHFDTSSVLINAYNEDRPFVTIAGLNYWVTVDGHGYGRTPGLWRVYAHKAEFVADPKPYE